MKNRTLIFLAAVTISACSSDEPAMSGFASVVGIGLSANVNKSLERENNGYVYLPSIGGVAFVTGIQDESIVGYSGLAEGVDVGAPLQASARFDGTYSLNEVSNVNRSSTYLSGWVEGTSGQVNLNANFNTGKLWGQNQADGFKVNGDINGKTLGGFIRYNGVKADLEGQIGQDGIVAAFQGTTETKIVVGGLVGSPR